MSTNAENKGRNVQKRLARQTAVPQDIYITVHYALSYCTDNSPELRKYYSTLDIPSFTDTFVF